MGKGLVDAFEVQVFCLGCGFFEVNGAQWPDFWQNLEHNRQQARAESWLLVIRAPRLAVISVRQVIEKRTPVEVRNFMLQLITLGRQRYLCHLRDDLAHASPVGPDGKALVWHDR